MSRRSPFLNRILDKIWEKPDLLFALSLILFFLFAIPFALFRPLWYDEMASRWLADANSFSEFGNRLRAGLDLTPPLYLFIQHLSVRAFGGAEWVGRLPALIGYAICLTFLYRFTAHRLAARGGITTMAVMMLSGTFFYASEGRVYGLIFGCAALAMWLWQRYSEQASLARATLCGLVLLIAASLHYYAVLLAVPFALAELVRIWQRKRLDWRMAAVIAAPPIAVIAHYPFIQSIRTPSFNPIYAWAQPSLTFPAKFWLRALEPGILIFVCIVAVIVFLRYLPIAEPPPEAKPTLPTAELMLLLGFVLLPVFGVVFAKLVTNALAPRYVFSAMLGFAVLAAHGFAQFSFATGRLVPLLLLAAFTGNNVLDLRWLLRSPQPAQWSAPTIDGTSTLPIVIDDYLLFAQIAYYTHSSLRDRLFYLTDPERLSRYTTAGQMELATVTAIQGGQFRGQADFLVPFMRTHPRFVLFEPLHPEPEESWLARDLVDRGIPITLIAVQSGGRWYLVEQSSPNL